MSALDRARRAKHNAFVLRQRMERVIADVTEPAMAGLVRLTGYTYDAERYVRRGGTDGSQIISTGSTFPLDHLRFEPVLPTREGAVVPRRLFLLWMGHNDITERRQASIDVLRAENRDIDVRLLTWKDSQDWEVGSAPFHPTVRFLSAVHRSDYMRAYLMYHYGGAYLDIKPYRGQVSAMLDVLDANPQLWGAGNREGRVHLRHLSGGPLATDVRRHSALLPSQAQFAFRPHTRLAAEWLEEVHRRLDYFSHLLERHPAVDPYGAHGGYPVPWFALLGSVYAPLTLKYHSRLAVRPDFLALHVDGPHAYR